MPELRKSQITRIENARSELARAEARGADEDEIKRLRTVLARVQDNASDLELKVAWRRIYLGKTRD
ncbi:hypothetical protein [Thermoactinospora rubra]|uniref:hypothetical protein n=1 Tax=Thermoactinospora rubra TaxID=1088767 RepID=UPI000A1028B3|nr:hypothetical protein [Thermoactinospora rubra]